MTLIMISYRNFYGQMEHPEQFVIRDYSSGQDIPLMEALIGTYWHGIIAFHPVRVLWNAERTVILVVKERLGAHEHRAMRVEHCTVLVRKSGPDFKIIH